MGDEGGLFFHACDQCLHFSKIKLVAIQYARDAPVSDNKHAFSQMRYGFKVVVEQNNGGAHG